MKTYSQRDFEEEVGMYIRGVLLKIFIDYYPSTIRCAIMGRRKNKIDKKKIKIQLAKRFSHRSLRRI